MPTNVKEANSFWAHLLLSVIYPKHCGNGPVSTQVSQFNVYQNKKEEPRSKKEKAENSVAEQIQTEEKNFKWTLEHKKTSFDVFKEVLVRAPALSYLDIENFAGN